MNVQTAALCQSQPQPVLLKEQFTPKNKKKTQKFAEKSAIKSNVSSQKSWPSNSR